MDINIFGERLRRAREKAGLTQKGLRDEMEVRYGVEVGRTYISELERLSKKGLATKTPTIEVAQAMARVCETSLDHLAGLTDNPNPPGDTEADPHQWTPEADIVAQLMDGMSAEKRMEILSVVRQMADASKTSRRRRSREIREILDSIEQVAGLAARREVERRLRDTGYIFPMDDQGE